MTFYKSILLVIITLFINTSAFSSYNYQTNLKTTLVNKNNNYEYEWKKVDSLIGDGLTKSALDVVNVIYEKAKAEKNAGQFVKAIIHQMKLQQDIEEYSLEKAIERLKSEVETAPTPLKNVLESMLAESYWQYYQTNRYKFYDRSTVAAVNDTDIATWDLYTIFSHVINHYQASLKNTELLKQTAINVYDDVLIEEHSARKFRPTLYDFLTQRALDFYKNEEPNLIRPVNKFELDNPTYFSPYNSFSKMKIQSTDSLSLNYEAIKLFQNLILFHINDKDPSALIDIEIKRLLFLKEKSTLDNKNSLFVTNLIGLEKQFTSDTASAEINYEIAAAYTTAGDLYDPHKSQENKWWKRDALKICEATIKKFPNSYGAKNCLVLKAQLLEHSLDFVADKITMPNNPSLALLTYKNLKTVYVRIAKLDKKIVVDYNGMDAEENLIKQYLKLTPLKEWEVSLIDDGDLQSHATEMKLPALSLGDYVILMGTQKTFSYAKSAIAYSEQWVSNISYIYRKMPNGSIDFFVQHRETGEPLNGVIAQLYYEKYNEKLRKNEFTTSDKLVTDKRGFFNIPATTEYRNFKIDFEYKAKKNSETDRLTAYNGIYQYVGRKSKEEKKQKTFFFLDRGVYRPGQTIHFKGIVISSDGDNNEILPNTKTTVSFHNVNNEVVSKQDLTTNEYGTFNGTFTAPTGVLNGQMTIRNLSGNINVLVEDYKRPKFEVTFNPIKGDYRLSDTIKISGSAKAFSGAPINSTQVKYKVVRMSTSMPFSGYFRSYLPPTQEVEITNGITITNDTGAFFIDFKALPDLSIAKSDNPIFSYAVYADVTDLNGETHSTETVVQAAYTALTIQIGIPELLDKKENGLFTIATLNMNGESVSTKGNVEFFKLKQPNKTYRKKQWAKPDLHIIDKEEYETSFPHDEYKDENNIETWPREIKVADYLFDNTLAAKPDSIKITNLNDWEAGVYVMEVHCNDKYGEDVKTIKYITIYERNASKVPNNNIAWFNLLTKVTVEPGNKVVFQIGTKEKDVSLIYEIEHKGDIIKQEFIKLNDNVKLIELPVEEKYRGNFTIRYTFVKDNRVYSNSEVIVVPYTNKALDISFETFRNKLLPGQKEEWKIKINDTKGDKVAAEMVATLYDASLDQFKPNNWDFSIYKNYYSTLGWETNLAFGTSFAQLFSKDWNFFPDGTFRTYEQLNWFGYNGFNYSDGLQDRGVAGNQVLYSAADNAQSIPSALESKVAGIQNESNNTPNEQTKNKENLTNQPVIPIQVRSNFAETAFFYPQLETDENGNVNIKFTIPDALTKWKMMGFAHTKDLKFGYIEKELVTQKELMVIPQPPRFFRENDKITFSSKVSNLSASDLTGTAQLFLYDAISMKELPISLIGAKLEEKTFTVKKDQSSAVSWSFNIPEGIGAITYKVVAKAGNYSDAEEMAIPVLTNRMLVTESLPLPIRGKQTKTFKFEKLISQNKGSTTLRNNKLTLEYTSNPAWYAIQALPYLMEYPTECSEQIFARYYANSIASQVANSSPKVKAIFNSWKTKNPEALLSNLEKNQELKTLLLQETPWVLDAKDETERKNRIALLFDFNKMSNELTQALIKLQKMQTANGGWPWMEGMRDDRYITQYIITGIGHLNHLKINTLPADESESVKNMLSNALNYIDNRINEDYDWLLKHDKVNMDKNQISYTQIQYLYARSFFMDNAMDSKHKIAFDYYLGQAKKYWLSNNKYMQGMIALILNRYDDKKIAKAIIKSLKENSIENEELGMYWKENTGGYYWHQAPIETQALLIEAFDEIADDKKSVESMKTWLLKSKQTQNWKTTKATADAVYALLLKGDDLLTTENNIEITIGKINIDPKTMSDVKQEEGTGYFTTSWSRNDIKPEMGNVTITKKNDGVSWGALYWQYFEQLDKITFSKTPLELKKQLFIEKNTASGPVIGKYTEKIPLKIGDKLKVRIELRVDRDMEYVQMKDMRASGFEPLNVISMHKYQDGLGYYESTRDASTNFFFDRLQKGTYVFEYPLVVTHDGNFSNGVTSIQCMYAPEFMSNSEGIRVLVK